MVVSGLSQDLIKVWLASFFFRGLYPKQLILTIHVFVICLRYPSIKSFFALFLDGLVRRFIRDEKGVHFDKASPTYDQKDFVSIEVKAGSLVVIHGDLIHQRSVISGMLFHLNEKKYINILFVN